jgi:Na+/proline symporter
MFNAIPYLSILAIAVTCLGYSLYQKKHTDQNEYFIGNRNTHWFLASVSIAATFLYASVPFFILKWQPIYGFAGGVWVILGIIIPLVLLGLVGYHISKKQNFKKYFNLTDLILEKSKSKTLIYIFLFVYVLAAIYNLSANLTAVGFVTEYFTSINYAIFTGAFLVILALYTIIGGFNAVVRTDFIQMVLILIGGLLTGLVVTSDISSPVQIVTSQFGNLFDPKLVMNIGATMTIIILGSAITDNALFQRIFSMNSGKKVAKAFGVSAVIYFVACFGVMFIYGGWQASGIENTKDIFAVLDTIATHGNFMLLFFFITAMISMSASNIDSVMHSISSMLSKYFVQKDNQKKISNLILLGFVITIYIVTQMKLDLWLLLTTFGTIRLTVVFPTLYIIFAKKIDVTAIIVAIFVGLGIGFYLQSTELLKLYTVLYTLISPLIVLLLFAINKNISYNKN